MDLGEDRISELPESLILDILSSLPTKRAVSTTVLSKRWNNLWMSMPVFDFRERRNITHDPKSKAKRFMDFLDRTLLSNNITTIQKFCLDCDNSHFYGYPRVREWITALIRRKVEVLVLTVRRPKTQLVPLELFTCQSLTMLDFKFGMLHALDFPQSISLPRLKVLRLSYIDFKDMASTQQFLSNCPILEELILCSCTGKDVISFSAPRLKYFVFKGNKRLSYNLKFEIDAPNLVSIKFGGLRIPAGSFPSLVEADFLYTPGDKTTKLDSFSKFVRMCSNIKLLKTSYDYLQIFDIENTPSTSFPTFDNLMHLEVRYNGYHSPQPPSINSLFDFLQFLPNLESLALNQVRYTRELNGNELTLNAAPHCLLQRLKLIEFQNFHGSPEEFELVKLFLKHARVLDQLVAHNRSGFSSAEMIRKFLMIPRASTHCRFQASSGSKTYMTQTYKHVGYFQQSNDRPPWQQKE